MTSSLFLPDRLDNIGILRNFVSDSLFLTASGFICKTAACHNHIDSNEKANYPTAVGFRFIPGIYS